MMPVLPFVRRWLAHGRRHPIAGQLQEMFAKRWICKLGKSHAIARVTFHILLVAYRHGTPSLNHRRERTHLSATGAWLRAAADDGGN
jgi:hypothetical protein